MAGSMYAGASATTQGFFVFQPVIRVWYGSVRHPEHRALGFQRIPEKLVVLLQADFSARSGAEFSGCQKMVEVGVGMD